MPDLFCNNLSIFNNVSLILIDLTPSKFNICSLSFKENEFDDTLNNLLIKSSYKIQETSKNSKGQVESFRSQIIVNLIINNKKETILNKNFLKDFSYANKENKYELVQYQNEVKNNLINKIIEDIILFINLQ